jgi:hypothetical protein
LHTPEIPALGRLRQEDLQFEVSLGYKREIPSEIKVKTTTKKGWGCLACACETLGSTPVPQERKKKKKTGKEKTEGKKEREKERKNPRQ